MINDSYIICLVIKGFIEELYFLKFNFVYIFICKYSFQTYYNNHNGNDHDKNMYYAHQVNIANIRNKNTYSRFEVKQYKYIAI